MAEAALLAGLVLSGGVTLQQIGLQYTSIANLYGTVNAASIATPIINHGLVLLSAGSGAAWPKTRKGMPCITATAP